MRAETLLQSSRVVALITLALVTFAVGDPLLNANPAPGLCCGLSQYDCSRCQKCTGGYAQYPDAPYLQCVTAPGPEFWCDEPETVCYEATLVVIYKKIDQNGNCYDPSMNKLNIKALKQICNTVDSDTCD